MKTKQEDIEEILNFLTSLYRYFPDEKIIKELEDKPVKNTVENLISKLERVYLDEVNKPKSLTN